MLILFLKRGLFNVMLVLQICIDSVQVLPGSSCEMFPLSSGGTHDVGNIKLKEDIDIKEEVKVNEADNGIGSEEEECVDIKDEEGIQSEEEEEETMDIEEEEEEDVDVKEKVSYKDKL